MATATESDTIVYPDSDGKPMAETDDHRDLMFYVISLLKDWFADDPKAYVSGNLFVYYVKGQPKKVLAPDVFVAFGVKNNRRKTFKTWQEGVYPSVVFEFTSASTSKEDLGDKFTTYQDIWKVKEYFLFDPLNDYLEPSLQGYRLSRGKFTPIRMVKGQLLSKELGITLERDEEELLLRDAETGKRLLTEEEKRRVKAERKTAAAEAKLDRAEAEIARLIAEIEALRKQSK